MHTITVGPRIREVRKADRGYTQAYLAERTGVTREHITRIETGRVTPSLDVLFRIAGALNVSIADLTGDVTRR